MARTPEATAKAMATRLANKQDKEQPLDAGAIETIPIQREESPRTDTSISIDVDWKNLPMPEAEKFYQQLKKEFDKAGLVLNARHTESRRGIYACTICGTRHEGLPKGEDLSWKDPETGLISPVRTCSEVCWLKHQQNMIEARRSRNQVA